MDTTFETPAAPDEIQRRDDQQREHGGGHHPADHGGRDAFHDIGAGSVGPHDGQQAQDDGRRGHDFGPDS
jgi:hypothetical protein